MPCYLSLYYMVKSVCVTVVEGKPVISPIWTIILLIYYYIIMKLVLSFLVIAKRKTVSEVAFEELLLVIILKLRLTLCCYSGN